MQPVKTVLNRTLPKTLIGIWIKVGIVDPLTDDWDAIGLVARLGDFVPLQDISSGGQTAITLVTLKSLLEEAFSPILEP